MNYAELSDSIFNKVMAAVALINNPEIDPEVRQLNQEILFREVGEAAYAKVYDMNAFDYDIPHTRGRGIDDRYYGLAKVTSASVSTGAIGMNEYVRNYIDTMISLAQRDATENAMQSGKRVRVSREIRGEKTCQWCIDRAKKYEGSAENIPADIWWRHGGCDCAIFTEGFKTRNGELKNYVKPKDR